MESQLQKRIYRQEQTNLTKTRRDFIMETEKKTLNNTEIFFIDNEEYPVTASALYKALNLSLSHFSQWCTKNIVNNLLAIENEDYKTVDIESSKAVSKTKIKIDYALTYNFAKRLCLLSNSDTGKEWYKILDNYDKASNTKGIESNTILKANLEDDIPQENHSYWILTMYPKFELLMDHFKITEERLYIELYNEFENRHIDIDLNQIADDFCYRYSLNECCIMEAIGHTAQIRKSFEKMVDELLNQCNLTLENKKPKKKTTIFMY